LITILTPNFPPVAEFGGPNKSLIGVCALLSEQDIKYTVISRNKEFKQNNIAIDGLNPNIRFKEKIRIGELKKCFQESEAVWLNTLYSVSFTMLPLLALLLVPKKKVLISPRGQLLKGALSFKKRLYLHVFKLVLKLSKHNVWIHYSNKQERLNSFGIFKEFKELQFNNAISGKIADAEFKERDSDQFVIGYFGRISAIKNIEFVLKLIPNLSQRVHFQIHGTILNNAYQRSLELLIKKLGITDRVTFCDTYNIDTFAQKSKGVDLIVIPSYSESFCHVFFEAIEVQKLIIGSAGLPWKDVNAYLAETILPFEEQAWILRMNKIQLLSPKEYSEQQAKLAEYYIEIFNRTNHDTLTALKKIIQ